MTPPVDARRALEQALSKILGAFELGHVEWLRLNGHDLAPTCEMRQRDYLVGLIATQLPIEFPALLHALSAERTETPEVVVCAAIRCANGYIIRGHRHDSCFRTLEGIPDEANPGFDRKWENQGFMTTRNRYVTREEACALQRAAGLISAQTGQPLRPDTEFIFSEDVY